MVRRTSSGTGTFFNFSSKNIPAVPFNELKVSWLFGNYNLSRTEQRANL